MRERISKSPVGKLLTLSQDVGIYEYENFLLEGALKLYPFPHWLDHLVPLHVQLSTQYKENAFQSGDNFLALREALVSTLKIAGFYQFAEFILAANDEKSLNGIILRQYTEETPLYAQVNSLLRQGHAGSDISNSPLAPWICQLAAALRTIPEFTGASFRGTQMDEQDLSEYQVGQIFIWAPFTSASKNIEACLGGNVIFELVPVSAISERGKRAPRDISSYSSFPDEEEVLLPMCCAYRPTSISKKDGVCWIRAEILDHY